MWDPHKKQVAFIFNENFLETLKTQDEFDFVISHEVYHLVNLHIFKLKDEVDALKKRGKSNQEVNKYMRRYNSAADCVVNDTLVNIHKFPRLEKIGEIRGEPLKPYYGMDVVKTECHDLSVDDVMRLWPDEKEQEGEGDSHESWQSFFNADGTLNKQFVDKIKSFVKDKLENSACSDEEQKLVDAMKEAMKNSNDSYASQAGSETGQQARPILLSDNSLNWNSLLLRLTDVKKHEDSWTKPNRKLVSVYPDIILPTQVNAEKEVLFIAIDSSGSINYDVLSLFASVVRNTPNTFKIKAISFDTECYDYNIKGTEHPKGGGGTRFKIIEKYIKENFKKYPKAVVVLTDGQNDDGPIHPEYANRWIWLLYGYIGAHNIKHMKNYEIEKLLKRD
jgi:predicted metal-dependent peptidase